MPNTDTPYAAKQLPIEDYGAIGNLRSVALIGKHGSIDWCCLPNLDDPSMFAALLDHERGGHFSISAPGATPLAQTYLPGSNVLETKLRTPQGILTVTDFMPIEGDIEGMKLTGAPSCIHRLVHVDADMDIDICWKPRFDYGRATPRLDNRRGDSVLATTGTVHGYLHGLPDVAASLRESTDGALHARVGLRRQRRIALTSGWGHPSEQRPSLEQVDASLASTLTAWRRWLREDEDRLAWAGDWQSALRRSELALKLLIHPETGAIAAAPTTSLPEDIGGVRNWDYRCAWIRDAAMTVQALLTTGHTAEAIDFVTWAEDACERGDGGPMRGPQVVYPIHDRRDLEEVELSHLRGYRGSRPVRVGNGAVHQKQYDTYGELLVIADMLERRNLPLSDEVWRFLPYLADLACEHWKDTDFGLWEVQDDPKHYVHSKLMLWVALDSAIDLSENRRVSGDVERWRKSRDALRKTILDEGYNDQVGSFVQSFGSKDIDASSLLIPMYGLLPFDDPRVRSTIDRVRSELTHDGLVHRYVADDGLPGKEGSFVLCSYWLMDALALSGRVDEAEAMFEAMLARRNHVGLLAEQIDPASGGFLGNFPQGFSHVGMIDTAIHLAQQMGRDVPIVAPEPRRTRIFDA